MRRCTDPVLWLPFEIVEKPNGLQEGVRHISPTHLATRLETRFSFIHSFITENHIFAFVSMQSSSSKSRGTLLSSTVV